MRAEGGEPEARVSPECGRVMSQAKLCSIGTECGENQPRVGHNHARAEPMGVGHETKCGSVAVPKCGGVALSECGRKLHKSLYFKTIPHSNYRLPRQHPPTSPAVPPPHCPRHLSPHPDLPRPLTRSWSPPTGTHSV